MSQMLNRMIAGRLEEAAQMLQTDGADPVHVRAFARAASSVRHWPISMAVMYRHRGVGGLEEVPGVGPRIADVIRELLIHHRLPPQLYGTTRGTRCLSRNYWALTRNIARKPRPESTVITGTHGVLRGHRVVAGHERECRLAERRAA